MKKIIIFDTENCSRYILPRLRAVGVDLSSQQYDDERKCMVYPDVEVYNATSLTKLVSVMDEINRSAKQSAFMRYLKVLMYGRAGSGKTWSATNIMIGLTQEKTEAPILLIDSATVVWKSYCADYMRQKNKKFMAMRDWGFVIPNFEAELLPRIKDYQYNILITGRMGFVYTAVKDDRGKITDYEVTDNKAKLTSEIAHEPDLVVEMEQIKDRSGSTVEISQQAIILKDRSGLIHGKSCINPDWSFFKPVWDYLMGSEISETPKADTTNDLALVDEGESNAEERRKIEICLDEIKNTFIEAKYGTSKEDKAEKIAILNKIFMASSWAKISAMNLAELEYGLEQLRLEDAIIARIAV